MTVSDARRGGPREGGRGCRYVPANRHGSIDALHISILDENFEGLEGGKGSAGGEQASVAAGRKGGRGTHKIRSPCHGRLCP